MRIGFKPIRELYNVLRIKNFRESLHDLKEVTKRQGRLGNRAVRGPEACQGKNLFSGQI